MSEYNMKSIKDEFKSKGIFYTPDELAKMIKGYVDVEVDEVYDPTCGDGALLSVFGDDVKKYGQEINDHQLEAAKKRLVNFDGVCGDTLESPAFLGKKFKCIVANPPFSIKWNPPKDNSLFADERFIDAPTIPTQSKADYAFLLHIIHYLSDDGIAVTLNFPGILYRGGREGKIRQWLIERNYVEKVVLIPPNKFVDTTISTALVIFKKNKTNTDIEFIDLEKELNYIATFDEVKSNDFNLSVSGYVVEEVEKVIYNPIELNQDARLGVIQMLKRDLAFDEMVCKLEGYDFNEYLDQLKTLINSYYK